MSPPDMNGSLLIVDRDAEAVRELRRMAGFPGVSLVHASSWQDVFEELARHRYDAVFIDLGFLEESQEDGFHQLETSAAGVPLVVMEREAGPELSGSQGENVFGHLVKPLRPAAVRTMIRQVFQFRALGEEIRGLQKWVSTHALKDPVTGLYNSRYLEERIRAEFKRALRYGAPLSVAGLSLEGFREAAQNAPVPGLSFPREVASFLLRFARANDVVTDTGSCHFAIILPDTPKKGAVIFAHRLLEAIRRAFPGKNLQPSFGVASYPYDGVKGEQNLLDLMRRAVERARKSGGSMVYTFPGLDPLGMTKRKNVFQNPFQTDGGSDE